VFNLFNHVNFANPIGTLPQAIPNAALSEANRVQPGQAIHDRCGGHVRPLEQHGRAARSASGTPRRFISRCASRSKQRAESVSEGRSPSGPALFFSAERRCRR
jgi:hypothetical protein